MTSDLPAGYTFVGGVFDWTPTYDDAGVYTATVTVSDGDLTAEETFTITVANVNRTPVLDAIGDKTISENANLNFTITGSDPDGNTLSYSMSSIDLPVEATFDIATQIFDWIPTFDDAGTYSATFTVSDGDLTAEETITITVTNTNQSPVIATIDDIVMTECDYLEITFSAVDPDGDPIILTLTGGNDSMKFVDNGNGTGDLTYNPSYDDAGVHNLTLSAFDGNTTSEELFLITVEDCIPPYMLTVSQPATVPGSRIAVDLTYGNECELTALTLQLGWPTDMINLDSVSFVGSGLEYLADKTVNIQNEGIRTINITANVSGGESNIPAGGGHLATLYFSLDAEIADDIYGLTVNDILYTYDCGSGAMTANPFLIDGGIGVQTNNSFTCGTIVDESGDPVADATVELWDSYPFAKGTVASVQTNSFGAFAFDNITIGIFTIYAYKENYYPWIKRDISPPASGFMIESKAVPEIVTTPFWMDFYCGTNTLNDMPIPIGSVVDAYTIDDIHVGSFYVTEEGSYGLMPVYGTGTTSEGTFIEAVNQGDVIRFFINNIEAIPSHTPIWTGQGDYDEVCLAASYEITHSFDLVENWNLISWKADTENDEIMEVLASVADCIEVVHGFEQGGLTYVPSLPQFSTLKEVDHLSGYWVKIAEGCNTLTLEITGAPVPETTPIGLTAGWNLVSYLPEISLPTVDALASIDDSNIDIVYGFEDGGSVYIPNDPLSTLDIMSSSYGYWIKVFANDILTYPGTGKATPLAKLSTAKLAADAGEDFAKTNKWVSLYSNALTLNGYPVGSGSKITAQNSDGVTVGSFTIDDKGLFGFMSVYADDPNTSEIDGVKIGETFHLVVDGHNTDESFTWTQNGDRIEVAALTTSDDIKPLPGSYSLNQNYPNPFNPSTTIKFSMAKAGQAKIEVYNILGKLVVTPFDGQVTAGANEITWDGTDKNGKTVSSGIYFYRLTADNYSETKKMTLLK
ncbi:MAG: hypothetical protein DRP35_09750 [Candidatus Zixiibacteriota bacterium]|nr:MAG: hypothetical protein DRP35_09750 [candidate division Zixibacteria bacterium]